MDISESTIRNLRKKAKSWLASLIYYSAQGKVNVDTFSRRLQSLVRPVLKPDILKEAVKDALPETIKPKEATVIRKRIMGRLTPDKIHRRMLNYPKISGKKIPVKDKTNSLTLGRLLIVWAVLTDQIPQDFVVKVAPNVNRFYEEWHGLTGCQGLSDEECYGHPKESAQLWSGIYRTLIRETPAENLVHFINVGIRALGAVIEMPGLEKEIYKLLGQASRFVAEDVARKIESALKANPDAKDKINIPELKALVLREEAKLGWRKNTETEAIKTLHNSLSPELKEAVYDNEEVIKSSLETVSRKGLLNNLHDALKGQLRPRFIGSIMHFLNSIVHVESTWEFDTSNLTQDSAASIRKWLFRR